MCRSILLNDNRIALISEVDHDLLEYKWYFHNRYVRTNSGGSWRKGQRKRLLLHRTILERKLGRPIKDGFLADHINGNTCDNRRENLREASPQESAVNRKSKSFSSKYKGVSYDDSDPYRKKRWRMEIYKNEKRIISKRFETELEAAQAYDAAALQVHGEFARLNFPT